MYVLNSNDIMNGTYFFAKCTFHKIELHVHVVLACTPQVPVVDPCGGDGCQFDVELTSTTQNIM